REQGIGAALAQARKLRGELHRKLAEPGGVRVLLNGPADWRQLIASAQGALHRAEDLHAGADDMVTEELHGQIEALAQLLRRDEADRALALKLEKIREDRAALVQGRFDLAHARRDYPKAFRQAGLALQAGQEDQDVARVQQSPIKEQLLAA